MTEACIFALFLCVIHLTLQGRLWPDPIYITVIWWLNTTVHASLYGLMGHITPSSWWQLSLHGNLVANSVYTKAHSRPRAVSQEKSCFSREKREQLSVEKGKALLQNPKGVPCDSPTGDGQRFEIAYLSATDTWGTVGFAGPNSPSSRAAWTAN